MKQFIDRQTRISSINEKSFLEHDLSTFLLILMTIFP